MNKVKNDYIEERIKIIVSSESSHVTLFSAPNRQRKWVLRDKKCSNEDLIIACKRNNYDVVRALIIEEHVNSNFNHSMCLVKATLNNNIKLVKFLAEDDRIDVSCYKYTCFRIIVDHGFHHLYYSLFNNIKHCENIDAGSEAIRTIIKNCEFKDSNIEIFKCILGTLKQRNNVLIENCNIFIDAVAESCSNSQFEITTLFFNIIFDGVIFERCIRTCVSKGSIEGYNFVIEYDSNNGCLCDIKNNVFNLLRNATTNVRPIFVELFLSLIDEGNSADLSMCFRSLKSYNSPHDEKYNSKLHMRSGKEIEDDIILTIQIYLKDGRVNIKSIIDDTFLSSLLYSKMFDAFNILLPFNDIFPKKVLKVILSYGTMNFVKHFFDTKINIISVKGASYMYKYLKSHPDCQQSINAELRDRLLVLLEN